MPRFRIDVAFRPQMVTIEVEADSLRDAWENRYELASSAEPQEWDIDPVSVYPAAQAGEGR